MTCEEALELISGHLDGENTEQEEAQLQAHLKVCPSCRELMQALSDTDQTLRNLETEPPAHFCEDVMAAVRAEKAPARKKKRHVWPALAAAALLLVIGVSALPGFQAQDQTAAEPMLARSADDVMEQAAYDGAGEEMAVSMYAAAPSMPDPQSLADERHADIAVAYEQLPELENRTGETLEDGSVLYALDTAGEAAELSRTYGLALYTPEETAVDGSYVLVIS